MAVTAILMARGIPLDAERISSTLRDMHGCALSKGEVDLILESAAEMGCGWFSGVRGCRWAIRPDSLPLAAAMVADGRVGKAESRPGCLYCLETSDSNAGFCSRCGLPWARCVHCGCFVESGQACDFCRNRLCPPRGTRFHGVGSRGYLEYLCETDGRLMVHIPSGSAVVGAMESDTLALSHERPAHDVYLHGFLMDLYPVTFTEYDRFCADTGARKPDSMGYGRGDNPVFDVSWREAAAFAGWAGKRLPTEAEWEKAARGPDGRTYPWGSTLPDGDAANFSGIENRPVPPGRRPLGASPYGCHDMAGNLWEWCQDWYGPSYYRTLAARGEAQNPSGPADGVHKVTRGGSWNNHPSLLRCSARDFLEPGARNPYVGFRLAMDSSGVRR